MVKYNITVYMGQRLAYFPKKLTEELGNKLTVLPDSKAAILWSTGSDLRLVAEVVRTVLLPDLELQSRRHDTSSKPHTGISQVKIERTLEAKHLPQAEQFCCDFCKAKFQTFFQLIEHYDEVHNGMRLGPE